MFRGGGGAVSVESGRGGPSSSYADDPEGLRPPTDYIGPVSCLAAGTAAATNLQ